MSFYGAKKERLQVDCKAFAKVIYGLAGSFSATISPATLDIWMEMLKVDGITYQELQAGVQRLIREKTEGYGRLPLYGELLKAIKGEQPKIEDRALVEANKILDHLRLHGAGVWPEMSDPITRQLMTTRWHYPTWAAQCVESENHWWVKEFVEAYRSTNAVNPALEIPCQVRPMLKIIGGEI
jgi:hypothetical protein